MYIIHSKQYIDCIQKIKNAFTCVHIQHFTLLLLGFDERTGLHKCKEYLSFLVNCVYKYRFAYSTGSTIHRYPVPIICRSFVESTRDFRFVVSNVYLDIMQSKSCSEQIMIPVITED